VVPDSLSAFLRVYYSRKVFWYHCEDPSLRPVEKAAKVHADLVIIYPFRVGNSRTSRLVMNMELMRAGFPTVIIPVKARSAYYENLDKAGKDTDYAPFAEQLAQLVERIFGHIGICSA
jgi:Fic family protein